VVGVDPADWHAAIDDLLDDYPARSRMSRNAAARATRYTRSDVFDTFWGEHVNAIRGADVEDVWCEPKQPVPAVPSVDQGDLETLQAEVPAP
jgi:hypothetical protein